MSHFGIVYNEFGQATHTIRFTKVKFFRLGGDDWPEPIRFFEDSTGIRWWTRRDAEQVITPDNSYVLSSLCNPGDRWVVRAHATVGDKDALRAGLRCLIRSLDLAPLLRQVGTHRAVKLAEAIETSTTKREADPKPSSTCDHCGARLHEPRRKVVKLRA